MPPESRKLLLDMLDAASSILRFVQGKQAAELQRDDLLRSALYYQFVIVGEALSQLRARDELTFDQISENWRIIGFRNQIIHGYGLIDHEITWRIIERKVPVLISELQALLKQ